MIIFKYGRYLKATLRIRQQLSDLDLDLLIAIVTL